MSKQVEIIDRSETVECYLCRGNGCLNCNNTGKYKKEFFHIIAELPNGQKIGFEVDQAGK